MTDINFKPLQADILLERVSDQEALKTNIYIKNETDSSIQHYKILAVGPDVKQLNVGDEVILSWSNITPPFEYDGRKMGITNEREVLGVIEHDS